MNPNSDHLSEVPNKEGLRIDKRHVRFAGSDRKLRALPRPLEKGESRILTHNPNVIAIQGYKKTSPVLRLATNPGIPLIEIDLSPNSFAPHFIIPKRGDIVWVLAVPPEDRGAEFRWRPWSEIHVYDFSGKKIRSLSPADVGKIRMARATQSGDLIAAQWTAKDKMGLVRFTPSGGIAGAFPIPFRHVEEMAVFNDGDFISLQTYSGQENKRRSTLYARDGKSLAEFAVDTEQTTRIPAVTPDGKHLLHVQSGSDGLWAEISTISGSSNGNKKFRLPFQPAEAVIPNSLDFIAIRSRPASPPAVSQYSLAIVDRLGHLLVETKCEKDALSLESQLELAENGIRWLCGDDWLHVEVESGPK